MEIKGVRYVGPVLDGSGYAKAGRLNILALHKQGIPLKVVPISFEQARPDLGENAELFRSLIQNDVECNINLIHTTPEFWNTHKQEGMCNIGYTIWETSKLNPKWPPYINENVNACFVGCEWNVGVFKDSGVTVPLFNIPHPVQIQEQENVIPFKVYGVDDNAFVYYFIGQWTERKHVVALLRSYWYAFQNNENVALVFKTHRSDYSENERTAIRVSVRRIKKFMPMGSYPPVYLVLDMLSEDEMEGLHKFCDCYVSLDRGEGFGLSSATAGAFGNPLIATGYGGVNEYANKDNSYLVKYQLTPVSGMPYSPWYRGDQLWAEPDIVHGAELMRHVYNNRGDAYKKGKALQDKIRNDFSFEAIGKKFVNAIKEL